MKKNKKKPVILITNDDGVSAPGLHALVDAMRSLGDIVVVAPDSPQSGMGHAVTINKPLRLDKVDIHKNTLCYQSSGTPADCVKLAVDKILHTKPDLVVSGINHGSNSAINVLYSGTISAAMEGAIQGIPSIGFSLTNYSLDADFSASQKITQKIVSNVLKHSLAFGTLLNVNIPDLPEKDIKGIKICRQAMAKYEEEFEERTDPNGRKYFWLTGKFINYDKGLDTDEYALKNNFVSVVPVHFDLTAHHAFNFLHKWEL